MGEKTLMGYGCLDGYFFGIDPPVVLADNMELFFLLMS